MKFKAVKKDALPVLKEVNKVIDLKSATNILRHMLLIADKEKGKIRAFGYNHTMLVESAFDAEVEEGGRLAILGSFINIIELSAGENFTLIHDEGKGRADIKTEKGHYQVSVTDPTDFPEDHGIKREDSSVITTTTKQLTDLIERSATAPDIKDERKFAQCISIITESNRMSFTGVNNQLMARAFIEEKNMDYGNMQAILYKPTLEHLKGMLPSVDIPVAIILNSKKIMFEFVDTKMSARLVEINYPDNQVSKRIESVNTSKEHIVINVQEFLGAARCILNISNQDLKRHDVLLKIDGNTMTIKSETEMASGEEAVDVLENCGDNFTCSLNGILLNKCLSTFKSEKVKIMCEYWDNGKGAFGLIGESEDKDKGVIFIIILLAYDKN